MKQCYTFDEDQIPWLEFGMSEDSDERKTLFACAREGDEAARLALIDWYEERGIEHKKDARQTYVRISKREARKRFASGRPVVMCPCKLRPGGPWRSDMTIDGKRWIEDSEWRHRYWPTTETLEEFAFARAVSEFVRYNCTDNETGRYPHFYVIRES